MPDKSIGGPAEEAKHEVVFAKRINQEILGFTCGQDRDVGFMKHVFPAVPAEQRPLLHVRWRHFIDSGHVCMNSAG
jgi:hypothetical protein